MLHIFERILLKLPTIYAWRSEPGICDVLVGDSSCWWKIMVLWSPPYIYLETNHNIWCCSHSIHSISSLDMLKLQRLLITGQHYIVANVTPKVVFSYTFPYILMKPNLQLYSTVVYISLYCTKTTQKGTNTLQ